MPQYHAPLVDIQFLLHDWLNINEHYQSFGLQDFDAELVNEILHQGAKFAETVIAPLNQPGDEQSCYLDAGKVSTPEGFAIGNIVMVSAGKTFRSGNFTRI